ncbi:MAG: AAA family ATPase [Marinobacter sp.]|nr:AAA family ATPase [Marinobacter sp.]
MATDGTMTGVEAGGLFPRLQQRFGLREDPLAMDLPFFPDAQRQHALESLRHLCGFGDMALLLTGAKGAGKTRILAELVRSESARLAFHPLEADALTSPQALARHLLGIAYQGLVDGDSPQDAIFGFFRWSESATRKGRRLVLLIDDADRVPSELIRLILAAHQAADTSQCAVPVLAGLDSLVEQAGLEADLTGGSTVHQVHLRPLVQAEIAAYLEPRVHRAGGKVSELLSTRNMAQIYELSQGSFGRLKRVTPAVWLGLASVSSDRPGPAALLSGLKWPTVVILLLAGSWWLVSRQYDAVTAQTDQPESAVTERTRSTITLGPDHFDKGETVEPAPSPPVSEMPAPEPTTLPAQTIIPPENQGSGVSEPSQSDAELIAGKTAEVSSSEAGVAIQSADAPVEATAARDAKSELTSSEQATAPPEPAPARPAANPGKQSGSSDGTTGDATPAWKPALAARFVPLATLHEKTGFTAQLIAGYEEATAVRFINQHESVANLHYTRSERKGRDWFVVFYGHESTKTAVSKAMADLPKALREHDSWIRPINTI